VSVADSIGPLIDHSFSAPVGFSSGDLLFNVLAYSFQIYGDFAGYSFIAIGVAKLQGFDFPANFFAPYFSQSFSEFWRRWHISLSSFLRDYLYVPLGGNRHGKLKEYRNLFITMLLGGLWHGASYNFAIWGTLHGAYLTAQRVAHGLGLTTTGRGKQRTRTVKILVASFKIISVYSLVCLAWVFFRIHSLHDASRYLLLMFAAGGWFVLHAKFQVLKIMGLILFTISVDAAFFRRRRAVHFLQQPFAVAAAVGFVLCLIELTGSFGAGSFIYFQF
jgi:alginate O-acetyltransferase complex protein AlgI